MTPTATATARRAPATSPRPAPPGPRRPPLRVVEPARRGLPAGARAVHRSTMWVSVLLVVASLLAVVVGDAMVADGQVRMAANQTALSAATQTQKSLQVTVAQKAAPPVVVAQAESHGLVAPSTVVDLPQVPLNVPLPVPDTAAPPTR